MLPVAIAAVNPTGPAVPLPGAALQSLAAGTEQDETIADMSDDASPPIDPDELHFRRTNLTRQVACIDRGVMVLQRRQA